MLMADTKHTDDEMLTLDSFLCFAVYSANHAFTRIYKPLLEELDLTYPQYLVMVLLWEKDDQTVGGLGERLFLESSTLTPMLKRLEAAGYIARVRDKADERQVRVQLTDMGKALRQRATDVPRGLAQATKLSPDDIERLRAEVSLLRDTLLK
ncbi:MULTISPECIES: MarR family transcriptional regulator [unclassified Ensifer]|uniref:MarR family winged helix-turn-helix transcriptional regulator n=1 Tax=unclassified Ensifer TaxID=2633371 RepID=UPI0008130ACF|nr:MULTISPECIES: MarR family transcriptional regulator [unclassified Ensifer]OCP02403.1 MarR family transcriptional regulator [Ensifer sp. LC14]OCP05357.1 MarR family transcriptional regulator [Ensifer sp. LC13]OCP14788.1 MarR family transcriptional regulator [Ensifer sp. LC11]OCP30640.1 MarR family transcriptional regulator [Ensifer sp. LC499]